MKKLVFRIVVLFVLISILVSFTYMDNKNSISSSNIPKGLSSDPVIALREDNILYNVMYPYNHDMDMLTSDCYTNFTTNQNVELYITNKNKPKDISYEIIDLISGESLFISDIKDNDIIIEEDHLIANLVIPEIQKSDYPYQLKIIYSENKRREINYYQNFYITDNRNIDNINELVTKFHNATFNKEQNIINLSITGIGQNPNSSFTHVNNQSNINDILWDYDMDIVKMNEPIIKITNINNNSNRYNVELTYSIAERNNHKFDYWNFTESYDLSGTDILKIDSFNRKGSSTKVPYYDDSKKQIILGSGISNDKFQKLESDNNRFITFVRNNELWLIDCNTGAINKIFGFDKLNGDYIVDNYNGHKIVINSIDDEGTINYMVYGYMNTGYYKGSNGISVYEYNYNKKKNTSISFINLPYELDRIDYYVNNYCYISSESNCMYIIIEGDLLQIDLEDNAINYLAYDLPCNPDNILVTDDRKAIYYKINDQIKGIIINGDLIEKIDIDNNKLHTNILGKCKNNIVVGYYDVNNTIEKLSGEVKYIYNNIKVFDSRGKVVYKYIPNDGQYYDDIIITQNGLQLSTVKRQKNISRNARYSSIEFRELKKEEKLLNNEEKKKYSIDTIRSDYGYDYSIIKDIDISNDSEKGNNITKNIDKGQVIIYMPNNDKTSYIVINEGKIKDILDDIKQALIKKELYNNNTYVVKSSYSNEIMYSSNKIRHNIIKGIPVIPQRPALHRGCEVTSLTMLLNYYLTDKVDKMQLAKEINKDITEYNIVDGMINFGDPHIGFVGDIADVNNKGYAVYNEPIEHLARKYSTNVLNITGSKFNDVLYYIGLGHPVWVISPNIYMTVPQSYKQYWVTPNGIKEVSYTSHAVLVVGYDSRYVYFNDPSKNLLRKKLISEFRNGWECMGSQAILIY